MNLYNQKWLLLLAQAGAPAWAVTIGCCFGAVTFFSCSADVVKDPWHRHEDCHKAQFRQDGFWKFMALYVYDYIRGRLSGLSAYDAYLAIRYEVEARKAEER